MDRIEAYRLLAVARCRSFDLAGAEVALRSAVELAEVNSCGSEVLAGLLLTVEGMADPDWLPWLRDALRRVLVRADHSTAVAARLTAELAFQEAFFDQQSAGVLSLRSSELADQSPDLAAQRASWRAQHFVSSGPEGVRRRLELADRMEASARDDGDPEAAMWGRLWRFDALLQLGDIAGAAQQAARLNQLAGLATSRSARWHTLRCAMTLAMARGRFDEALEAAGQAFALAAATGNRAIAGLMAVPVLWVSAMTGRRELAEPLVGELGRSRYEYAAVVLHWWSVQTGEKVAASDGYDLRPVLEEAQHRLPTGKLLVLTIVADLVDAYGDVAMARETYTALAPYADLFASNGAGGVAFTATVHTPLGMTAAVAGGLDDAVGHLRRGVAAAERTGAPVCAVLARLHLARVLGRRRRPGDAAEATALARVVVTEANRLGMTPTAHRAETLIGEPTTPLTVRETEIARLVAQGLTNRQIAAVTHISERTVETHVARCLAKLHCATRARLVRAVLEADG